MKLADRLITVMMMIKYHLMGVQRPILSTISSVAVRIYLSVFPLPVIRVGSARSARRTATSPARLDGHESYEQYQGRVTASDCA